MPEENGEGDGANLVVLCRPQQWVWSWCSLHLKAPWIDHVQNYNLYQSGQPRRGDIPGLSNRVNLMEGIAYPGDWRAEEQNRMGRQPRNYQVSTKLVRQSEELAVQTPVLSRSWLQRGHKAWNIDDLFYFILLPSFNFMAWTDTMCFLTWCNREVHNTTQLDAMFVFLFFYF